MGKGGRAWEAAHAPARPCPVSWVSDAGAARRGAELGARITSFAARSARPGGPWYPGLRGNSWTAAQLGFESGYLFLKAVPSPVAYAGLCVSAVWT